MITKVIDINYKGHKIKLEVRPDTQDEPMARGEVFDRDYYRQYGGLKIEPGDVVFDLGANVGSFTMLAGIEGAKTIVAVEPLPDTIALLEKNIKANETLFSDPVTVFRGAVMGQAEENATLFLCNDPFGSGSHTLTLDKLDNPAGFKTVPVKAITLDKLIEDTNVGKINFLKMDIEGAEYEVLKNCHYFPIIRQISMEWHHGPVLFADLLTFLKGVGYKVAWFEGDDMRGKLQVIQK